MEYYLQLFILIPAIGLLCCVVIPQHKEKVLSKVTTFALLTQLVFALVFIAWWLSVGAPVLFVKHATLFQSGDIEIFIALYGDQLSLVFALVGSLAGFLLSIFSRYYLHRDEGYRRYFGTFLFFLCGYNILVMSGNFETFFVGWEIVGLSSFLLIAFYRDRYLPVKNAMKVVSVYRIGDVCLILAMWMSHHLWSENITFVKLNTASLVALHLSEHAWYAVFVSAMIVLAATAKSAQFPFSSWLPRAMEGPTTSTALFYGSLSLHLGVFLLLRTFPYWENIDSIRIMVVVIGVLSSVIASLVASVQSTLKSQIAYASIAQLGLMFIEIGAGWHTLVILHFIGHAFLRSYQLLVSPSVLSYTVHDMQYSFQPRDLLHEGGFRRKFRNTLYVLSLKEWNLDAFQFRYGWLPFKKLGRLFHFVNDSVVHAFLGVALLCGILLNVSSHTVPQSIVAVLPMAYGGLSLALILKAFTSRGDAILAWSYIFLSQVFVVLSISLLNESFDFAHIGIYLSGSILSALVGYLCLRRVKNIDNNICLDRFHGYSHEQPRTGFVFLLSGLAMVGLPFTPTFIGIDVMFSHIHRTEVEIIVLTTLGFLFIEISVLRIYTRIFLGQHKKLSHPVAFRST